MVVISLFLMVVFLLCRVALLFEFAIIVCIIIIIVIIIVIIIIIVIVVICIVIIVVIVVVCIVIHSCSGEITIGHIREVVVIDAGAVRVQGFIIGIVRVVVGGVKVNNWAAIMPSKGEVMSSIAAVPEGVHVINDILWEQKLCPTVVDQMAAGGKAHKVVASLTIASGVKGNGTISVRLHRVIMFLMGLDVAPKLKAAVFVIIQIKTHHKHLEAESVRHAIMGGKHVEPEDACVDHLFKHEGQKTLKGDGIICKKNPLI